MAAVCDGAEKTTTLCRDESSTFGEIFRKQQDDALDAWQGLATDAVREVGRAADRAKHMADSAGSALSKAHNCLFRLHRDVEAAMTSMGEEIRRAATEAKQRTDRLEFKHKEDAERRASEANRECEA